MRIHVYHIFLFVYRNKSTLFQSSLLPFVPGRLVNVGLQCARFIYLFFFHSAVLCLSQQGLRAVLLSQTPLWAVQPFCPLHSSAIFRYCSLSCCRRLVAQWLTGLWDNRAPSSLPLASIYSRQRLLSAPGPRSGPALLSRVWVFMLCVLGLAPIPHQSSACEGELRAQTGFNHLYRRKERQRECLGYYKTDHSNQSRICSEMFQWSLEIQKIRKIKFTVIVTFFCFKMRILKKTALRLYDLYDQSSSRLFFSCSLFVCLFVCLF